MYFTLHYIHYITLTHTKSYKISWPPRCWMLVCWWATIWTNALFRFSRRACCGKFSSRVRLILIRFFRFFDCRLLCPVQERPTQATVRKISFLLCGGTYEQAVAKICRKIWGSGSVRSSHQTVSDYTLRQWFPNTQQFRFLTGCIGASKISFTFHFLTQVFHPSWCETCRVIQQQFWTKECDIFGVKHTLALPTYFQTPNVSGIYVHANKVYAAYYVGGMVLFLSFYIFRILWLFLLDIISHADAAVAQANCNC